MIETKNLTGAQSLLKILGGMGVERIFASPGSEWAPLWEALAEPRGEGGPVYMSSRHEEIAFGMASGYAKASGKLPGLVLHTTVGTLHTAMGLRAAMHEEVPMVVFSGESIGFGEGSPDMGPHWVTRLADIGGPARLVQNFVKWSFGLNNPTLLPSTIQRACKLAMMPPRGPVFVSVPMEYLFAKMTTDAPAGNYPAPGAIADPDALEELAEMLAKAENPIIITEHGGRHPDAATLLVELAETIAAPVVEVGGGFVNFPRRHFLQGGFESRPYLKDADVILLIGCADPWHPPSNGPGRGKKVVAIDENPLRADLPYWGFQLDLCLTGGIAGSLKQLLKGLKSRINKDDPKIKSRTEKWRSRYEETRRKWREEAQSQKEATPIDDRWLSYELGQVLPQDAMVVQETITHSRSIYRHLENLTPGSYFGGHIGGLGTGLGTALGVKVAAPKKFVACVIGDGSFNYDPVLAALGFCQEFHMPILTVIYNNLGYLSQKSGVPHFFPEGWAVKKKQFIGTSIAPSPEYAVITRAFDGYGEKVEKPADVRPALERGIKAVNEGRSAVIDVRLTPVNE